MNNMSDDIAKIMDEYEGEASEAKKYYSKWAGKNNQKIQEVVDAQVKELYSKFVSE